MKTLMRTICTVLVFGLAACASGPPVTGGLPIDQVPMYGGMDRRNHVDLKAGDEKFIEDTTRQYGSRENASAAFAGNGFVFYHRNDLVNAIRRFNQAWLINPENAQAYWGFASVLHDRRQYCQALNMAEISRSKGNTQPAFLADAGFLHSACGRENTSLSTEQRQTYYRKSDEIFEQVFLISDVRKEYVLYQWARALFAREDYANAWAKVAQYRQINGRDVDAEFLGALRQRMPEPK
jgi:tetratricopeptide (TPR) repeat protein